MGQVDGAEYSPVVQTSHAAGAEEGKMRRSLGTVSTSFESLLVGLASKLPSRPLLQAALGISFALAIGPPAALAAGKAKKPAAAGATAGKAVNACGCYADTQGNCFCGRKGKCACPGQCEPKGCEEKRAKQMDKEVAAETRKAAEADKKQQQRTKGGPGRKPGDQTGKVKAQDQNKPQSGMD
jgi:hypothetical protein